MKSIWSKFHVYVALLLVCVLIISCTPSSKAGIQAWLTLPDGSKKLISETALAFTPGSGNSPLTITVDEGILYQQVDGIGAAMTDSSAWLIWNKMTEKQRNTLMSDLFTRKGNGIGLSYIRIPIGASDFALSSYTYDDLPTGQTDPELLQFSIAHDEAYIIPLLKQAKQLNPQLSFIASPWSAPAWMKTGENLNGGSLKPEYFQAFAEYLVKFVQAYEAAGIPITALTAQNEPMNQNSNYPTMTMSSADQLAFIVNNLGPALESAGLDTKIIILDHNWNMTNYSIDILNDPAANALVAGTAFHCYEGQVPNQSLVHEAYPDKGIWFTECSGGAWATDFGDNVSWNMRNLVMGNFRNWGKSLILWNLALDENAGPQNGGCNNCRGVVTINASTGEATYNEEYYVLGHLSKIVNPGAYRIESTSYTEGEPENAAFLNSDGSIALVVHSTEAATFDVAWNGGFFTYTLPASGTVTFKWPGSSKPGATVTPAPTKTPIPTALPYPAGPLQDFEAEGSYFDGSLAKASLSGEVVHGGASSLQMTTDDGNWHSAGAYFFEHPINATAFNQICLWVYDTTVGDNTLGLTLFDAAGMSQEAWSDHYDYNPKSVQNEWVQMCFGLDKYSLVDLTQLDRIEMKMYWPSIYYFDDITGAVTPVP